MHREFWRFSRFAVNAALNAEVEYGHWTKDSSILFMGCEHLISTSVARAAAAFYGIGGDFSVLLECPVSRLKDTSSRGGKTRGGRVDCVVFKAGRPRIIIECKRAFHYNQIENDAKRCCDILNRIKAPTKCALLIGFRLIHEGDKKDRNQGAKAIADKLSNKNMHFRFEPYSARRDLEEPIEHITPNGHKRKWISSVAQCITIKTG